MSHKSRKTLSAKDIQHAVKMFLPGELTKPAVSEVTKAVVRFNKSREERQENPVKKGANTVAP